SAGLRCAEERRPQDVIGALPEEPRTLCGVRNPVKSPQGPTALARGPGPAGIRQPDLAAQRLATRGIPSALQSSLPTPRWTTKSRFGSYFFLMLRRRA